MRDQIKHNQNNNMQNPFQLEICLASNHEEVQNIDVKRSTYKGNNGRKTSQQRSRQVGKY